MRQEPALAAGLLEIKREIEADAELVAGCAASSRSRTPPATTWRRSSTAATPLDIFRRLIVGSEGTLAFIVEAVFEHRSATTSSG